MSLDNVCKNKIKNTVLQGVAENSMAQPSQINCHKKAQIQSFSIILALIRDCVGHLFSEVQKEHKKTEKLTKRHETRICSATYHNKTMYQVSVEYVKGFGKKKSEKPQVGQMENL